jgi:hypothetical protein
MDGAPELLGLGKRRAGGSDGFDPTLRKSAKDGAPEVLGAPELLGLVKVEAVVRAVSIPPFAKARRMGHPSSWGWGR